MKKYFLTILFIGFWGCDDNDDTESEVVDNTNPEVSITSPNFEGEGFNAVFDVVTIASAVYDNIGIDRVEFLVDESIICTDTEEPYECEWDTDGYEVNSEYIISVKAYDISGNLGQNTITVIVDDYVELWGESYSIVNTDVIYVQNDSTIVSIPEEIASLINLEILDLSGNSLFGEIPPVVGDLINLKELRLNNNQLNGEIPAVIGNLINLEVLSLAFNQITGEIIPEIGFLVNLDGLNLSENSLEGEIPVEIGSLINLTHLQFSGNNLTGTLPSAIGNLINLYYFNVNDNNLSGELPIELGNLTALEGFMIAFNNFSGVIPEEICGIPGYIEIGLNAFCDPIPDCIQNVGPQDTSDCP